MRNYYLRHVFVFSFHFHVYPVSLNPTLSATKQNQLNQQFNSSTRLWNSGVTTYSVDTIRFRQKQVFRNTNIFINAIST